MFSYINNSAEIILEKEYVGPAVDIWSMGVILYALVNGQLPWRLGKNGRIIDIDKLLAGQFENSASANLSKGAFPPSFSPLVTFLTQY